MTDTEVIQPRVGKTYEDGEGRRFTVKEVNLKSNTRQIIGLVSYKETPNQLANYSCDITIFTATWRTVLPGLIAAEVPTGETCHDCGGLMYRTGSCFTCRNCGSTNGCG